MVPVTKMNGMSGIFFLGDGERGITIKAGQGVIGKNQIRRAAVQCLRELFGGFHALDDEGQIVLPQGVFDQLRVCGIVFDH